MLTGVRGGVISFDLNGDTEDSYIAVGSRDLFVSKNKSLTDVSLNIIVPFGYFRGTVDNLISSTTVTLLDYYWTVFILGFPSDYGT